MVWLKNIIIWSPQVLLTFNISYRYRKKKKNTYFFPSDENSGFTLNNSHIYHTAVLTIVIMLYVTSLVLIYFIIGYLSFDNFHLIPLPALPVLVTTNLISFSMSFFFFNSLYEWDHIVFIFLCLISLIIIPSSLCMLSQVAGFSSFWSHFYY